MLRAKNIEERIFDITNSATKTTLNAKINEFKKKQLVFRCISISALASFISTPIGIASSAIGLKICAITAKSKKYKSTAKKKKKKHDKIVASITNLAAITTAFNAKTNEFKNKITNIAN